MPDVEESDMINIEINIDKYNLSDDDFNDSTQLDCQLNDNFTNKKGHTDFN